MKNWYKNAKLIDVQTDPSQKDIHTVCQYCERVCTHPDDEYADRKNCVWKRADELDAEEKAKYEDRENYNRSHGICDICMDIMERSDFEATEEEIINESLGI